MIGVLWMYDKVGEEWHVEPGSVVVLPSFNSMKHSRAVETFG